LSESSHQQLSHLDKLEKEMIDHLTNTNGVSKAIINRLPIQS